MLRCVISQSLVPFFRILSLRLNRREVTDYPTDKGPSVVCPGAIYHNRRAPSSVSEGQLVKLGRHRRAFGLHTTFFIVRMRVKGSVLKKKWRRQQYERRWRQRRILQCAIWIISTGYEWYNKYYSYFVCLSKCPRGI